MPRNAARFLNLFILRNRLLIFMVALMILLITFPIVHEQYTSYVVIVELLANLLLIFGIYIISDNKRMLTIAVLIAILAFTVIWFNIIIQSQTLLIVGLILEVLFFAITTVVILGYVLTYKRITADKIYGSICGYLLIGFIWTLMYTIVENIMPSSFVFDSGIISTPQHYLSHRYYFEQFIYYSFVTLTTLGYGDITPITTPAKVLASVEAVIGQLYVAILIARLVGLHIGQTYFAVLAKEHYAREYPLRKQ